MLATITRVTFPPHGIALTWSASGRQGGKEGSASSKGWRLWAGAQEWACFEGRGRHLTGPLSQALAMEETYLGAQLKR